jgi:plasmid stabilization system protein ParE
MRLIFRPEAEEELLEAIDWYETRSQGLGAEFVRCVDACLGRIQRNPESYPIVHRETRMAVMRRFPYLLLYRIHLDEASIVAVFHAKRNPKQWKGR